MPSIYVAIADYRDSEIESTVRALLENTTRNVTLNIHVFSQRYLDERVDLTRSDDGGRIVITQRFVTPDKSRGICWGRAEAQRQYSGEDFYLQIDGHVQMTTGWDEILLNDYAKAESDRPVVLTAPLACYELVDGQRIVREKRPHHFRLTALDGRLVDTGMLLGYPHARPCRAFFFAGHFAFARGRFVEDVPYDPEIFCAGEEISMAVRAYSCGYDLYTPSRYVGAHLYQKSEGNRRRPPFWDAGKDGKRSLTWAELEAASNIKVGAICRGEWRGLYGNPRQIALCRVSRSAARALRRRLAAPRGPSSDQWRLARLIEPGHPPRWANMDPATLRDGVSTNRYWRCDRAAANTFLGSITSERSPRLWCSHGISFIARRAFLFRLKALPLSFR